MNNARRVTQVTDREQFYAEIGPMALAPLWEVMKGLVPHEPRSKARAHKWDYGVVRPLLLKAGELLTAEEAERRVLVLENPNLSGTSRATNTLYAGIQLILPGEVAPAHKHTAAALRFVLESEGGYTTVAGERCAMHRGDFLVTPSGLFHDHGHEGDRPVIWVDGLDVPIVNFFEAGFSQELDGRPQELTKPEGDSTFRFGKGLLPFEGRGSFGDTSPIFSYRYSSCREALLAAASAEKPDQHHGHRLRYSNPLTGGWVMPTMASWLTYLPAGFETSNLKSTDGQVIVVSEGALTLQVDGATFELQENDVAVIPSWAARSFASSQETIIFSFSDRVVQEKLGIFHEQRL